jgi:transcription initiation factor TFIID subunit 3
MSSPSQLNQSLLRPCILQILRATGFHSARPSVIDALTDITARFLVLLASRSVYWAQQNHKSNYPDVTDIRLAMTDCGMLAPNTQASEEVWKEILRQPLDEIPERNGLRSVERTRRDDEDTEDVQAFVGWFAGPVMGEIGRISGQMAQQAAVAPTGGTAVAAGAGAEVGEQTEDFLTGMRTLSQYDHFISNWEQL